MKRQATAIWKGSIKEGNGTLSSQSGVLDNTQYSFKSRFEEGKGTNPEELIAAAHAGCFAMQLSAFLTEEDFEIGSLEAKGEITLKEGNITKSHITLEAKIDKIDQEKFDELVNKAKKQCPVSKLLDTEISVESTLN
ncbi:OsmC family protein [Psychroflexus sp. YR1-1]|uniref:OsmC family protein n=1 Tax=Psychroflexus aurantiacus TaxID=2709310 RepID=A0A6B3QWY1_9FLAO|nr:OsmC family protein [Psychroflexus aurantiacus]NEV92606.1 OsmC family protein [Psychroflexus aurantiacus]